MEPTIMTGDLIITKSYDGKSELKEGDVIAFFAMEENTKIIKTHRIKSVLTVNGMTSYVTKGDNNTGEDPQQVAPGDIISVWNGTRLPVLGTILTFLKTKVGFFICIILPLAAFFIYQLYKSRYLQKAYTLFLYPDICGFEISFKLAALFPLRHILSLIIELLASA